MEIDVIGHASLLVRTNDIVALMDPVLWDPHQEGLFDVFPKRDVLHALIPKYNLLVISHHHLDHFDIRSLSSLSKTTPVLIPADPLMERLLREIGYSKIRSLNDFTEITIGSTRIFATRSEYRVPELGFVISDSTGTVWNQVDSCVTSKTVEAVLSRFPQIDLLIASWQPMLEDAFQTNKSLSFPYDAYGETLYNIGLVRPRLLVPGANAFCYNGGSEWMNSVVFPCTRERFLSDVKMVSGDADEILAAAADPGDKILVSNGDCKVVEGGCRFVQRRDCDRSRLDFKPVVVDGRMRDENCDGIPTAVLLSTATKIIEDDLTDFIVNQSVRFSEHRRWKVVHQITLIPPEGTSLMQSTPVSWSIDFSSELPTIRKGRNPLSNIFTYITASALYGLSKGSRGWDYAYLGGYYRTFGKLYAVTPTGINKYPGIVPPDPLQLMYPPAETLSRVLDLEARRWSTQVSGAVA